jgi:hypothetical protein
MRKIKHNSRTYATIDHATRLNAGVQGCTGGLSLPRPGAVACGHMSVQLDPLDALIGWNLGVILSHDVCGFEDLWLQCGYS